MIRKRWEAVICDEKEIRSRDIVSRLMLRVHIPRLIP